MRNVSNTKLASRNRKVATYLFFVTMIVLVGGFIFINYGLFTGETPDSTILLLQSIILPIAFILTLVSVRMTNQWVRKPRPEDAIEAGLKGLSNKSVLYNYYYKPANHILICPQGVFVLVTKWHNGRFSVTGSPKGDQWKSHQSFLTRIFSALRMDGIGNPTQEVVKSVKAVETLLQDINKDVPVRGAVVFIDPSATIEVNNPSIPVLYADNKRKPNLTTYLRDVGKVQGGDKNEMPLTPEEIEQLEAILIK
ncbi:hypothetical protein MASR2M15_28990 [Anaerolineales bacterium]